MNMSPFCINIDIGSEFYTKKKSWFKWCTYFKSDNNLIYWNYRADSRFFYFCAKFNIEPWNFIKWYVRGCLCHVWFKSRIKTWDKYVWVKSGIDSFQVGDDLDKVDLKMTNRGNALIQVASGLIQVVWQFEINAIVHYRYLKCSDWARVTSDLK